MKRQSLILLALGGLLLGLFLAGCAAPPEITPAAAPPPTPAVVAGGNGNGADVPPVQAVARFPLPAPSADKVTQVTDSSNCITCHTNEESVQELAVEPEKEESLSEGEG